MRYLDGMTELQNVKNRIIASLIKSGRKKAIQLAEDPSGSLAVVAADGSNRRFYRFTGKHLGCIAAFPEKTEQKELHEARAAYYIGTHLKRVGGCTPEIYGYDAESGMVLYEDLGAVHLYDVVKNSGSANNSLGPVKKYYEQALSLLAFMQLKGAEGFDTDWCWDTRRYDKTLMLERESSYFYKSCWLGLLKCREVPGIDEDFLALANEAAKADSSYFLHRDFQSKNIMIVDGGIRFIDFQGGRLGPLAYDAASLLIDPYVQLPDELQQELFDHYVDAVNDHLVIDHEQLLHSYNILAIQRNLQFTGAFCFLGVESGKPFFRKQIRPALISLNKLLIMDGVPDLPVLRDVATQALEILPETY